MYRKLLYIMTICLFIFHNNYGQKTIFSADSIILNSIDLGEVVVSASKDGSKLKKLPASVSIVSSSAIEENEVNQLSNFSGVVPNYIMPEYGSKLTSPVYIRGIGSRINSPSVGLYIDNIPHFEKAVFDQDFFDIDRIEVLRGPQGTLYGRNSMGGLINIQTKSPMYHQGTNLRMSAGNYGFYKLNVSHYEKKKENFAFSLAANYRHNDGFYTNKYLGDKADKSNSLGVRNRLIFKINKRLLIENIASIENSEQNGYPYALYNDSLDITKEVNYDSPSAYDRLLVSNGLRLNYSKQNWELENTFSYQYLDDSQDIDQDLTATPLYFVIQDQNQHTFAEELILRSKGNKKLNWLFGAFAHNQSSFKSVDVTAYSQNMEYVKDYDQSESSLALFHQSTYAINQNLNVTAGLRYDYERSELNFKHEIETAGTQFVKTDTIYPALDYGVLLPKLAISYQLDKHSLYASYSTGYKPGGFNSILDELPEKNLKFKNEISHNFELGYKSSFFRNFVYADIALFYIKLKDQQIYQTGPTGRGAYYENAGLSENKGIEFSLKSREISGFRGAISYGYTHSKILEYVKDSATNYNNNFTPYIPRHTLAIQLSQTIPVKQLRAIDKIRFNILYRNQGILYWDLENELNQKSYGLLQGKVSFIYKSIQLDFWGKNLLSTDYHSFLFEALGNTYAQKGRPLQVGINLSFKF